MKRVNHLYEQLVSDDNLKLALLEVNKTHRWFPHHKPNRTVAWVEKDIPKRVEELREIINSLIDGNRSLRAPKQKLRWDKSAEKWRTINEPYLWPEQYVHHALIQVLQPAMMRGMDRHCCGSIKGRGIHYGVHLLKKWMKEDVPGTKYCLELDIHHFYESIQPKFVLDRMRRLIKDHRTMSLIERVLEQGVQIGIYCSQWFANTLLQPLDRMIREGDFSVKHYLRYMDNFTIFGTNKRKLHNLLKEIQKWLGNIGLEVKNNWQVFPTASRMPTALGYRYAHVCTLLRKRNLLRLRRKLKVYYKKRRKHKWISVKLATGLLSRLGQLTHCNGIKVYRQCYKKKTQRSLKKIVRKYSRKERLSWNTFLDRTTSPAMSC